MKKFWPTITPPEGSEFIPFKYRLEAGGAQIDGFILRWYDAEKYVETMGDKELLAVLDGTSLRVTFRDILVRGHKAKASADQIATAMIEKRNGRGGQRFAPTQRWLGPSPDSPTIMENLVEFPSRESAAAAFSAWYESHLPK